MHQNIHKLKGVKKKKRRRLMIGDDELEGKDQKREETHQSDSSCVPVRMHELIADHSPRL